MQPNKTGIDAHAMKILPFPSANIKHAPFSFFRTENRTEEVCKVVMEEKCRAEFVEQECHDNCHTEHDTVKKMKTEDR